MFVFEIYADGRKIGITIATSHNAAMVSARSATTRGTESKMDMSCDFGNLFVCPVKDQFQPLGSRPIPDPQTADTADASKKSHLAPVKRE